MLEIIFKKYKSKPTLLNRISIRDSGRNANPTIGGEQDNAMIRLKGYIVHATRGSGVIPIQFSNLGSELI